MFSLYQNQQTQPPSLPSRDNAAPAQFFAGWFDIVVQEDQRDYILDCYNDNTELTNVLYNAMEAYIASDFVTGDKEMAQVGDLFNTAASNCDKIM